MDNQVTPLITLLDGETFGDLTCNYSDNTGNLVTRFYEAMPIRYCFIEEGSSVSMTSLATDPYISRAYTVYVSHDTRDGSYTASRLMWLFLKAYVNRHVGTGTTLKPMPSGPNYIGISDQGGYLYSFEINLIGEI
jgi:hypothetical protein